MVSKNALCITGGVVLGIIGAALIVIGLLAPSFVNHQINTGVKSALTLEASDVSKSSWANYVTTYLTYSYYLFSLQNPTAWMAGLQKAQLKAVGPFIYTEATVKYNYTFDTTAGVFSYNQWWQKVWAGSSAQDDAGATNLNPDTTTILNVNPAYIAQITYAHAQAKKQVLDQVPALSPGYNASSPTFRSGTFVNPAHLVNPSASAIIKPSEKFFFNAASNLYMAGLADTFLNNSQTFITSVRYTSVFKYLNTSVTNLVAHGLTQPQVVAQWYSLAVLGQTFYQHDSTTYASLYGFEICQTAGSCPSAITATVAQMLFDPTSSVSIVTTSGLTAWVAAASGTNALLAPLGANAGAIAAVVLPYLGTLLTTYSSVFLAGINSQTHSSFPSNSRVTNGDFDVASWTDVGALQFGCLLVAGASVQAIPPAYSGPEWGAYLQQTGTYSLTNCLSVSQAKAFLSSAASSATQAAGLNVPPTLAPTQSTFLVDLLSYRSATGFALSVIGNASTGNVSPYQATYAAVGITDANKANFISYITDYSGFWAFYEGQFDQNNFGLFTLRTATDLLFGYSITKPQAAQVPGLVTSYTSQEQHYAATKQGLYRLYSGVTTSFNPQGATVARMYESYKGVSFVSRIYDLTAPDINGNPTINIDATTAANCIYDLDNPYCTAYQPTGASLPQVVITGASSTATVGAPFRENNPIDTFAIYLNEAVRNVIFSLDSTTTVDYKGIHMYKYTILKSQLQNVSANAMYYQYGTGVFTPNGLIPNRWYTNGNPSWLSQPFFLSCDSYVQSSVNLLYPNGSAVDYNNLDKTLLDTYVLVEPLSGYIMYGRKRLQLSVELSPAFFDSSFRQGMFAQTAGGSVFVPVFWGQEAGNVTDSDASDFRKAVYDNRHYADIALIVGLAAGIPIVVIAIFCIVYYARKPASTSTSTAPMERIPSREDLN